MALLHFNRDMERLKARFVDLFALVDEALKKALKALNERNETLAEEVIRDDRRVDAAEVEVEEECLKILALHQPIAQDLRYLVSILKINRDLERVGDQAVAISHIVLHLRDCAVPEIPELKPLIQEVTQMMRWAFDAFLRLDVELARKVWSEDDRADDWFEQAIGRILSLIRANPARADRLLPLYSLVHILERVADHATNVAKDTLYSVLGEIVRHRGREFKLPPAPDAGANEAGA